MKNAAEIRQQLREAARTAHEERELPADVLEAVEAVGALPPSPLVDTLLLQLEEYDPYAGTGCFCGGTSLAALKKTLALLGLGG